MTSAGRWVFTGILLAAGVAAGLGLGRRFDAGTAASVPERPAPPAALAGIQDSFSAAAEFAMQSVVHITTDSGFVGDPWQVQGVGSGVVVSAEGHILTNNHVAEAGRDRAGSLRVRFSDGKEFPARVMGADQETDLALLKIDAGKDARLVPAVFADSDRVRVGDWCLAIGSPFGYNHTVTAGIVSAKHRRATLGLPYQDFIQTDAAINPGNSGGALVNIRGELLGINTAIVTESRGNDGVGLAIASNLVRWVKDCLVKDGRVRRGFLGIRLAEINAALVEDLKERYGIRSMEELLEEVGLKEPKGVYVFEVDRDSPAAKAGIKENGVITEINGKPVSLNELLFKIAESPPGTEVVLKVLRDGKQKEHKVVLGERPPQSPNPRVRPRRR